MRQRLTHFETLTLTPEELFDSEKQELALLSGETNNAHHPSGTQDMVHLRMIDWLGFPQTLPSRCVHVCVSGPGLGNRNAQC